MLVAGLFSMMSMMSSGNHANCLAGIPGSPECVGGMDPLQFAVAHINAFLSASLGIAGSLAGLLLAALILLAWLVVPNLPESGIAAPYLLRTLIEEHARSIQKQRHWIARFEKRDPSFAYAMN